MRLGVWYDFRNPAQWRLPWSDLYRGLIDQAVYAEQLGFSSIWLSEHHFLEEGYLPSLAAMLGVMAERTSVARIGTAVLLAPLHHPLRLAEDLALIDQLSGGRLDVGMAPGYRPEEFRVLGVPRSERGSRTDETIELLQRAWTGERFSYSGKHFEFDDVIVSPPPAQAGGPQLWIGGNSPHSASRAARYGAGFMPDSGVTEDIYRKYLTEFKGDMARRRLATNRVIFAAETKEKAWELSGEYFLYQFNAYRQWFSDAADVDTHGGAVNDPADLSPNHYFVGTPDDIIAGIRECRRTYDFEELIFWARPPGMPIQVSTRSLELIAAEVMPEITRL